jgi:pimeloyl-ACP methyl ester carboxylesterase
MQTESGYLQLDGGRLYYEAAGAGDALVLAHAGFVDSRMWDGQWEAFAEGYHVIRYDMRGYGKSDRLSGPVNRRDELLALLGHLGVERAHLLGCSMGGAVMIDFALEHPEAVISLIPVSAVPSGFPMQGEPPPNLLAMMAAVQQGDLERASELQLRIWVDGMFREPEQVDPAVRERAAVMNRIAVRNQTWMVADSQDIAPLTPPAVERLREFHMPVLALVGALDHPEILRAADVMAAGMPDARKAVIPDTAHVPNMEKPAEFNRLVLDFLRGVK